MLEACETGTLLTVWVVPGAKRTNVVGAHGDAVKVRVAAPAEGGRANKAMIRLLQDRTNAPCVLQRGHGSRRKSVLIGGLEPREVAAALDIEWADGGS